ncbi:MAG: HAMP domain-containing sensor histidine kinase [Bacteroidota bacterium]
MNLFNIGVKKSETISKSYPYEIVYTNISSLVVSGAALIVAFSLVYAYGWINAAYISFGLAILINLNFIFNYYGYSIVSRIILSIGMPVVMVLGNILAYLEVPDEIFVALDVRILFLATTVLPILLFGIKERLYLIIGLIISGLILLFFVKIHLLFGIDLTAKIDVNYGLSTVFYLIAYFFIVSSLLIFKIRWSTLYKSNQKLLLELEDKVAERTEELEKHSEELVRHNNELEQFSFTVSHNIGGPIAKLKGLTRFFHEVDAKEQNFIIDKIQSTANSLDSVITDLNEVLQVRSNSSHVKEQIQVIEEISKAQQLLSVKDEKGYAQDSIKLDIKQSTVYGIRAYVQSILYNLISNAFKYRRRDVDPVVKVTTATKDQKFYLEVADNGLGINLEENGDKLFKLYARFASGVKGKGIGLYLVKKQVDSMGGNIAVNSKINEGTTFQITLPIPDSENLENQIYYEDDYVAFIYNGILNTSVVLWKGNPSSDEFIQTLSKNLKTLTKYKINNLILDAKGLDSLTKGEVSWFTENVMPTFISNEIEGLIVIQDSRNQEELNRWEFLKDYCLQKSLNFELANNIDEVKSKILTY